MPNQKFNISYYDSLVENSDQGSIFAKSWWLDLWSPNWYPVYVENNIGELVCACPLTCNTNKINEFNISNPLLTRYLGIMFRKSEGRDIKIYSLQEKLTKELLDKFPNFSSFNIFFHYNYNYWLPLRDKGYSMETYYTYIIKNNQSKDELYDGLRQNIRREMKKAEKKWHIEKINNLDTFFSIYEQTFIRQKMTPPVSFEKMNQIDKIIKKNSSRLILGAYNGSELSSVIYILEGINEFHYLMGGSSAPNRTSGASSLLLWDAIRRSMDANKDFNFEGSMNPSIIRYFRNFGGVLTPYFRIYKDNRIFKNIRKSL